MRCLKLALIVSLLFLVTACATYRYGDRSFSTSEEALAAQKAELDGIKSAFTPLKEPLAKHCTFVIPSAALIKDRAVRGGNDTGQQYVATVLNNDYRTTGEIIKVRNIFEKIDIQESADADHIKPSQEDVVIYLYMPDNKTRGWYYLSATTKRTPLQFDLGNPDKIGRMKFFIDSVEALAAGEGK